LSLFTPSSRAAEPPSETAVWAKNKADDLFYRGKYSDAYAVYETAEKYPSKNEEFTASLFLQKGLCRLKEKRASDAFSLWSRMRGLYPKTTAASQSLLLEAEDPTNKGKLDRFYDEILAKYPQSEEAATVLQKRGQTAFDKKDYAKAAEHWAQFVSGFPSHKKFAEVKSKLESAKLAAGGNKAATGEMDCKNLLDRANALFDRASFQQAVPLYQEIVNKYALSKEASRASGCLARCLQNLGKDQEALAVLQRMVDKNPEGASQALGEIVLHAANHKMDPLRMQATQQLLDRYPNTFEAQQALFVAGSHANARKDRSEAEKFWSMLLTKYPETPFRAVVERELGSRPEEKKDDKASVLAKEDGSKEDAERKKRWEKECADYEMKYRDMQNPVAERAESAYQWGERHFCLRQYEKAVQQYQRVWEEFPDSIRADEAALRAAQAWLCDGQSQKGEEQLLFLTNRFPQSPYRPFCLFCLGNRKILYEADLQKAWEYYDQLLRQYPQDPLAEQTRVFWAGVSRLSKEKLREQVAAFTKQQKIRKGSPL
jgi:TolA-binding protein